MNKTTKKKENIRLKLILSGVPGYFKLRSKHDDLFKITAKSLRNSLDYIEEKLPGNVEINGLYNAYTEEIMARRAATNPINEPFTEIFPKGLYADSGGLQMITLGKGSIEAKDRKKIYETQAKYSHYAMSFDEIPAQFEEDDLGNEVRFYDDRLGIAKQKGIESGEHLFEQYEEFEKYDTDCKIIPIAQGWDHDFTRDFAKGLFSKVNKVKKYKDKLDVVATGFPNNSPYGSAKRLYDLINCKEIPVKARRHIHMLGLTGFKRLIPALQMVKNGFAPDLEVLSFDSITISMSYVMGNQTPTVQNFKDGKTKITLGKTRNPTIEKYWQEIYDFWEDDPEFPFDDLDDMLEHSYYSSKDLKSGFTQYEHYLQADDEGNYTKKNKKIADMHFAKVLKQEQYYILYQVHNYVQILEAFLEDEITLKQIFKRKDLEYFASLEKVKTDNDFKEWFDHVEHMGAFYLRTVLKDKPQKHGDTLFDEDQIDNTEKERKKGVARKEKEKKPKVDASNSPTKLLF